MHCRAHQKKDHSVNRGNARADREAKRVATLKPGLAESVQFHALIPSLGDLPTPQYTSEELKWAESLGLQKKNGWLHSTEGKVLLPRYIKDSQPLPLDAPVHSLQPDDFILVRTWKDEPLQEKWKGPYLVLLVSHTAAKVEGHKSWIHYSRLKAVPPPQNPDPEQWMVQPTGTRTSEDL
ncbi:uncharacterized protein LOC115654230 isoform X3 [Gopherus evgoodei]|uniref:uncharacterized protein LOC115654230 isoform X3 n=1 Tax=Gopherus evgoodei TaxID=1825980 RepID=UPI0011CFFC37|nr:uncharacterized protein LOC115654230 isoform X3 [Gopherus evgoodei]